MESAQCEGNVYYKLSEDDMNYNHFIQEKRIHCPSVPADLLEIKAFQINLVSDAEFLAF